MTRLPLEAEKKLLGKIQKSRDTLSVELITGDGLLIKIPYESIESIKFANEHEGSLLKAHYFNYPVGTKFGSTIHQKTKKITETHMEVEIVSESDDEMKIKTTFTANGCIPSITFSDIKYENNRVGYSMSSPEMQLSEGDGWLYYPVNPKIGDVVPDIFMSGSAVTQGVRYNFKISYTNTKVVDSTRVTTKAGEFKCYVLTTTISKVIPPVQTWERSILPENSKHSVTYYISDQVGIVKSITYDKAGKEVAVLELNYIN